MWIFTPVAFTSIAYSKRDPTVVMFRFRTESDASSFRDRYLPSRDLMNTAEADYHWRIIASEDDFRDVFEKLTEEFTTTAPTNVKGNASAQGASGDYKDFMHEVWRVGWNRQNYHAD